MGPRMDDNLEISLDTLLKSCFKVAKSFIPSGLCISVRPIFLNRCVKESTSPDQLSKESEQRIRPRMPPCKRLGPLSKLQLHQFPRPTIQLDWWFQQPVQNRPCS